MSESKTKDYVLVAMVEPQEVGYRFSEWPLHITLLPWFTAPSLRQVVDICRVVVNSMEPFEVAVKERAHFGGSNRKLPVMLIEKQPQLMQLHNSLLKHIQDLDWNVAGRYTGRLYKPHVTRHHGKDAEGSVMIDAIYIVEKLEQGYRKVVSKISL